MNSRRRKREKGGKNEGNITFPVANALVRAQIFFFCFVGNLERDNKAAYHSLPTFNCPLLRTGFFIAFSSVIGLPRSAWLSGKGGRREGDN